jgi:heme exporter protein B
MILLTLLKQDLKVGLRQRYDIVLLMVFTLVSALLFPMAIGPESQVLERVGVGLIWVLVLFATHLAMQTVWRQDMEDGTLEQLCLGGFPLEWVILAKALGVWMLSFGSLLLLLPFLGFAFGMAVPVIMVLIETFVLVSLPLSFLTVTGGLMTQGNPRSAVLSMVILLPLYIPLLIFSSSACDSASAGHDVGLILSVLVGISLALCPILLYVNVIFLQWMPE